MPRIPIFPLDVVFFPETQLPLHIFEPRYRKMLLDALAGEQTIGIQLLNPGSPADDTGRPAVREIGCAGEIVEHETLEDGRSNIVLQGLYRYRLVEEHSGEPYRQADVEAIATEPLAGGVPMRAVLREAVSRLASSVGRSEAGRLDNELTDEGFVNETVLRLGLDVEERYRLLAMDRLDERYGWILEHILSIQRRLDFLSPYRRREVDARWN